MKKLTIALAAVAAVASAPAFAADLRVNAQRPVAKAPAYAPAPVAFWNGFYVGAQGGYQWGRVRQEEFAIATGLNTGVNPNWDASGAVGGLHAGFNLQSGAFVYGLEGDIEASGVRGDNVVAAPFTSTNFESRWQGSVRGRLGVAMGPALLYATGGLAFAELAGTYYVGGGPQQTFRSTEAGWTVGAGVEYALAQNWTSRIEYRYTDYGRVTDNPSAAVVPGGFGYRNDVDFHTLRVGVSYKFGGGPVAASY